MEHYIAHFVNDPNKVKGAVVSTFNGQSTFSFLRNIRVDENKVVASLELPSMLLTGRTVGGLAIG